MTLPTTPSALLRLALADLALVEADPKYKVDMSMWHASWGSGTVCHVCLAGAVLAKSLGVQPDEFVSLPSARQRVDYTTLNALDHLRIGRVVRALELLGVLTDRPVHDVDVISYEVSPALWRAAMNDLVVTLEAAGV